jgi:hypothetical protein
MGIFKNIKDSINASKKSIKKVYIYEIDYADNTYIYEKYGFLKNYNELEAINDNFFKGVISELNRRSNAFYILWKKTNEQNIPIEKIPIYCMLPDFKVKSDAPDSFNDSEQVLAYQLKETGRIQIENKLHKPLDKSMFFNASSKREIKPGIFIYKAFTYYFDS